MRVDVVVVVPTSLALLAFDAGQPVTEDFGGGLCGRPEGIVPGEKFQRVQAAAGKADNVAG